MNHRLALIPALLLVGCASTKPAPEAPDQAAPAETMVWSRRALPTGHEATSPVLLERGTPGLVPVGQPHEYEIRVTNLTDQPLDDVVVSERLGAVIVQADPEPLVVEGPEARWSLATLGAGETRTIHVTAKPMEAGDLESRCDVSYRVRLYGMTSVYEPKLEIEPAGPTESLVGEPVEYRLEVRNPGRGPVRNVLVSGTLPVGVETVSGNRDYRIEVGELGAGAAKAFVVKLRGSDRGDFILKAAAVGAGDVTAHTPETMLAIRRPVLEVETDAPAEWVLERPARYAVQVRNSGDGTARDAKLLFTLPEGAVFVRGSGEPVVTGEGVEWSLDALAPDTTTTIEVFVNPGKAGTLTGTARLSAQYCKPAAAEWRTVVAGAPSLRLEVADSMDPVVVGGELTYRVLVTNQGSAPARAVRIACTLEETMELVSTGGASRGGDPDGAKTTFAPIEELAPGATAEWTITIRAIAPGDVRFRVALTSAESERPVEDTESSRFYR